MRHRGDIAVQRENRREGGKGRGALYCCRCGEEKCRERAHMGANKKAGH